MIQDFLTKRQDVEHTHRPQVKLQLGWFNKQLRRRAQTSCSGQTRLQQDLNTLLINIWNVTFNLSTQWAGFGPVVTFIKKSSLSVKNPWVLSTLTDTAYPTDK